MAYHYQMYDNFFDIESLNNLYVDSHYFVAQHRIEIFYLCDVNHVTSFRYDDKSGHSLERLIHQRILNNLPELARDHHFQIVFYNLSKLVNLKQYFKLYGITPNATSALAYMNRDGKILPPSQQNAIYYHGGNSLNIVHHAKPVDILTYNQDLANHSNNPYRDVPGAYNVNFRYYPPKRTDPHFNPFEYGHGEMMGYNSANYDLTMVAHLLGRLIRFPMIQAALNLNQKKWSTKAPKSEIKKLKSVLTPQFMRKFNDQLFSPKNIVNMKRALIKPNHQPYFKRIETPEWYIYKGWKQTNRFLDVSDFNRRVSLKRIEATMGMHIQESSHVVTSGNATLKSFDDLANVIAYNINDIYATRLTFELPVYQDALTLRRILLRKFPALIYDYDRSRVPREKATAQDVKIAPDNLRFTRLNCDFSSAQFIINVIAPYHAMKDIPGLNYSYPDPRVLRILKQRQPDNPNLPDHPVNILDQTMLWARQHDRKYHTGGSIARTFFKIYNVYKRLQYHNVNPDLCDPKTMVSLHKKLRDSDGIPRWICPYVPLKAYVRPIDMNIPYVKANGKPSSCIVTFSIGGIHGLEVNQSRYIADLKHWQRMKRIQKVMMKDYGSDSTGAAKLGETFILKKEGLIIATRPYVKRTRQGAFWRHLKPPHLFKRAPHSGRYILRRRYAYITVDPCQHEDFSGYYPMLISRLGLFWPHDQPTDTYRHLYIERLHLKHQLRKYTKNSKKWNKINLQQKLRKLLLNAGSGAGAGQFTNNLRMNNAMVSMRIIGQLFAWRIGEAETLAGGRVPSTNTDGMYVMDLTPQTNNHVLFKNVNQMLLDIVPSPLVRFVSKDANNRVEVEQHGQKQVLTEAKGSTLRSWQGPSPSNHLSHPAIADWTLAHYLAYYPGNPSEHPFNVKYAMQFLNEIYQQLLDPERFVHALAMFQWVNISNRSKQRYLFLQRAEWDATRKRWYLVGFNELPITNRLFMIKNDLRGINHFIKIATNQRVKENGAEKSAPYAREVLLNHGYQLKSGQEFGKVIKVTDMPDYQNVYLNGKRLSFFTLKERRWLYDHLDRHAYMNLIRIKFNSSWRNR